MMRDLRKAHSAVFFHCRTATALREYLALVEFRASFVWETSALEFNDRIHTSHYFLRWRVWQPVTLRPKEDRDASETGTERKKL